MICLLKYPRRLTTQKISALEGAIALKTDQTTTSDLEVRVATAEQNITPTAITSTVRASEEYRADLNGISGEISTVQDSLANKANFSDIDDMATTAYVQNVQSTTITQSNDAIALAVSNEKTRAQTVEGEIKSFTDVASTYLVFNINGLNIGKVGSPFSTLLGDDKLSFNQNGIEVAYIQYNRLYISVAEIMDTLTIGNSAVGYTDIQTKNNGVSAVWRAE